MSDKENTTPETNNDETTTTKDKDNTNYSTFDANNNTATDNTTPNNNTTTITKQPTSKNTAVALRFPEQQETEKWKFKLFGCMEDKKLCLWTCLCPCFTMARNASYFHEDRNEVALFCCLGGCMGIGGVMRWRIRQHKKIQGHMLEDVLVHMLCPCCSIIQENREIYGAAGSHAGEELMEK